MLVVTLSLHSARTKEKKVLGEMVISNWGNRPYGDPRGDYDVAITKRGSDFQSMITGHSHPWRTGEVKNFPRKSYSVWRLVMRALKSAIPEEKG